MTSLGFIGLGQIGAPMASHLAGWPGGLTVCDLRPEATAPFAARGAHVAASPADVAERADVISIMVRDDAEVREVVAAVLGAAGDGTVVAIHSTIAPATAVDLADSAHGSEVAVVDAPVSGGFIGATNGTLAVMVGGVHDAVERCREPFGLWADLFVHAGPVGSATLFKLARNLLTFAGYTAALEAQRLADAAGLDLRAFTEVVTHSDGVTGGPGAILFRDTITALAADDALRPLVAHTAELGEKDLRLVLELGDALGVDLPFARLALDRFASSLGLR